MRWCVLAWNLGESSVALRRRGQIWKSRSGDVNANTRKRLASWCLRFQWLKLELKQVNLIHETSTIKLCIGQHNHPSRIFHNFPTFSAWRFEGILCFAPCSTRLPRNIWVTYARHGQHEAGEFGKLGALGEDFWSYYTDKRWMGKVVDLHWALFGIDPSCTKPKRCKHRTSSSSIFIVFVSAAEGYLVLKSVSWWSLECTYLYSILERSVRRKNASRSSYFLPNVFMRWSIRLFTRPKLLFE